MEHYEVESSMIDRMGYDAETRVLEVLGSSKAHCMICESIRGAIQNVAPILDTAYGKFQIPLLTRLQCTEN
jgi:hypothetical protein